MQSPKYKVGAIKRKLGVSDTWKPGQLISEMNKIKINPPISKKTKVSIMGLV